MEVTFKEEYQGHVIELWGYQFYCKDYGLWDESLRSLKDRIDDLKTVHFVATQAVYAKYPRRCDHDIPNLIDVEIIEDFGRKDVIFEPFSAKVRIKFGNGVTEMKEPGYLFDPSVKTELLYKLTKIFDLQLRVAELIKQVDELKRASLPQVQVKEGL